MICLISTNKHEDDDKDDDEKVQAPFLDFRRHNLIVR